MNPSAPTTRRTALVVAAASGLAIVLPVSADGAGRTHEGQAARHALTFQSPLSDLQPATPGPVDGARAMLTITSGRSRTVVVLSVRGIDRAASGATFGAHLHSGPCVPGDGAAAGPHYNSSSPPVVDGAHEVWLDFRVTSHGDGYAKTVLPFTPVHGARSVVIHEMATNHDTGAAGARLACFPVVW